MGLEIDDETVKRLKLLQKDLKKLKQKKDLTEYGQSQLDMISLLLKKYNKTKK